MRKLIFRSVLVAIALALSASAAHAADIRVLASTGMQAAVEALKPQFEKATGDTLSVDFSTTATLRDRIDKGEAFDVAGMMPAEYQTSIQFAAVQGTKSGNAKGAAALIAFLDGKAADAGYKAKGMEPR